MGLITLPYSFTPGTTIVAAEVNSNFTTCYNEFNGSINGDNVSAIVESKVTFSGTGHAHSGGTGGAPVQLVAGANIASGATITITTDGNYFLVTGTTTITALSTRNNGVLAILQFADALTFTHNGTSLILPGAANITTAAGDIAIMKSEGSGNWRCLHYLRAAGAAVSAASQAEMEAATSVTAAATAGRLRYHPGVAKAWVRFTPAGANEGSYNVASVDDDGTGDWGVNFTTAFSAAGTYTGTLSILGTSASRTNKQAFDALNTTSAEIISYLDADGLANEDGITSVLAIFYGDQA